MMNPEIGPVRAQLLGGDGQLDGLQQRVRAERVCDCRRRRPMSEGENPIFFMRAI